MKDLSKDDRDIIVSNVMKTVETKHFDPRFDKERWRAAVHDQQSRVNESCKARSKASCKRTRSFIQAFEKHSPGSMPGATKPPGQHVMAPPKERAYRPCTSAWRSRFIGDLERC